MSGKPILAQGNINDPQGRKQLCNYFINRRSTSLRSREERNSLTWPDRDSVQGFCMFSCPFESIQISFTVSGTFDPGAKPRGLTF